jgi:phosphopantothenoylcysteine decarboxylase/phosphopantothenate--cysteine ligase
MQPIPLSRLINKRILLGVTGGIAAYKAAEVVRLLRKEGADVRVVMTTAATTFVTPLTFQALSGNPVHLHLLDAREESAMDHIRLARWADLILIAPATADCLARMRMGLADDLLSTLCLAALAPLAVAPAMNGAMWEHPATRENVEVLRGRGVTVIGPGSGDLACGETGWGRMLEPEYIVDQLFQTLGGGPMENLSVLISAGPTREPIDPVRYIGNRSSGKMGYALAAAAAAMGARVTLVSGPTALGDPPGLATRRVETAADMYETVLELSASHDIYIGAAAVADYTPSHVAPSKIKKADQDLHIGLTRTRDILQAVAESAPRPFTVGFAAETDDLERYAKGKLQSKGLDMIAANWIGQGEGGFDSDRNALTVYWPGGERNIPLASKQEIANHLLALILEHFHAKNSTKDS